jgi:hypothetical protein
MTAATRQIATIDLRDAALMTLLLAVLLQHVWGLDWMHRALEGS